MSKSKVFKEILVLFNVVIEPAGNTKQTVIVQQAGPRRSGSFCYTCNKHNFTFLASDIQCGTAFFFFFFYIP